MSAARRAALAAIAVVLLSPSLRGAPRLSIRVSPAVSMAPALVVVRATIDPSEDNRVLEVTADSPDFFTSSQLPLQGAASPKVHEVRLNALPPGTYEITAVLAGPRGQRASAASSVFVTGMGRP